MGKKPLENAAQGQGIDPQALGALAGQPVSPGPAPAPNGQGAPLMQAIGSMLGGGNPQQEQNNSFVQKAVNDYMAQQGKKTTHPAIKKAQASAAPPPQQNLAAPLLEKFHTILDSLLTK